MNQPLTRQQIYDRIRETSKDEFVLEEMIRLGFYPRAGTIPQDPAEEIRRKGELERQLSALTTENSRLQNVEALKRDARQKRLDESRQKRQENKLRRLELRRQRAEAWQQRKLGEILYLGPGVSAGLNAPGASGADPAKLTARKLPVFESPVALAQAMGVSLGELRFLAFSRRVSQVSHYRRFAVPKKTGGQRVISAPMPRLKAAQRWILETILNAVAVHDAAHGFALGRSIVSNARPHVGAGVVLNLDLKDFFPTVSYRRVKGVFRKLGYPESVAIVLALVCTEPETVETRLDGRTYYVARSERRLPQGAPTSPAITNILCRGLDARLKRVADKLGFTYTRYADDITFSGSGEARNQVGRALRRIRYVVQSEGFVVHPDKVRVLRRGRRQEVTGLVVNDKLQAPRATLRKFRATLYQIERDGPVGKRWGSTPDVLAAIEGYANFVAMVDPEKGKRFQAQVARIIEKYGRSGSRALVKRARWKERMAKEAALKAERDAANQAALKAASQAGAERVVAEVVKPSPASTPMQPPAGQPPGSHPLPGQTPTKPWWKFWSS